MTENYVYKNKNCTKTLNASISGGAKLPKSMVYDGETYYLAKKDLKIRIGKLEIAWRR